MTTLIVVGVSTAAELKRKIGHMACSLGGVNYESRSKDGVLKGSVARGATHTMFRRHGHLAIDDAAAQRAKAYADACIGQPYVFGDVPLKGRGGDCSGYVSGIVAAALGKPVGRLFGTSTWGQVAPGLGFRPGLGAAGAPTGSGIGILDRPFPGTPIGKGSPQRDHVAWIQARLDFAAGGRHPVLGGKALPVTGVFDDATVAVLTAFQKARGLQGLGLAGPKTWPLLNALR